VLDHATGAALRQPREAARGATGGRLRGWLYALGGLAGAALVALAITLGQLGGARGELAQIRQQLDQAELQIDALTREREQIAQAVADATELARLEGPGGGASVLRAADGELLLAAQLPPLASGQVYQLWLIAGQEAPVSGGVFTVGGDGVGVLALGPGAAASGLTLAVTAEPGPDGSPGPTTDVLIIGELS
jgi:hypothetical protein